MSPAVIAMSLTTARVTGAISAGCIGDGWALGTDGLGDDVAVGVGLGEAARVVVRRCARAPIATRPSITRGKIRTGLVRFIRGIFPTETCVVNWPPLLEVLRVLT